MNKPAGVILAGGRSSRMGVTRKALVELNGQPLLNYVTDRLEAHLQPLLLSCESKTTDFDGFGLTLIPDLLPGFRGPLMGLYSTLEHLANTECSNGLLLCPCDAPFVPRILVQALQDASDGERVAVPAWRGVMQPTFSLWPVRHHEIVREALLGKGLGGPRQVLARIPHEVVEWERAEPPPFFNVNTPADLAACEKRLGQG